MRKEIAQFLQAGQEAIARIRVPFLIYPVAIMMVGWLGLLLWSCSFCLHFECIFCQVEHVIREQNVWAAYEILEMFCEFVLARVPILESQRWNRDGRHFLLNIYNYFLYSWEFSVNIAYYTVHKLSFKGCHLFGYIVHALHAIILSKVLRLVEISRDLLSWSSAAKVNEFTSH